MTTSFQAWIPQLAPELPECPVPLMLRALRNATREFCQRSTFWRVEHAPITQVTAESGGVGRYELTIPEGAAIVEVVDPILHRFEPAYLKAESWLNMNWPQWQAKTGSRAVYYLRPSLTSIRLVPYPTTVEAAAIRVTLALQPSPIATGVDDAIYQDQYEAITAGALAELMNQNNKPWTDIKRALVEAMRFKEAIAKGKGRIVAGYSNRRTDRRNVVTGHYF